MTDESTLETLRRYSRKEVAAKLAIPETWLKVWVSQRRIPHQRSGQPGSHQRGVWFTYDDLIEIGRMLPSLMTDRQGQRRADDLAEVVDGPSAPEQEHAPLLAALALPADQLERFKGLRLASSD